MITTCKHFSAYKKNENKAFQIETQKSGREQTQATSKQNATDAN